MLSQGDATIGVPCDCGHVTEVSLVGHALHNRAERCRACGCYVHTDPYTLLELLDGFDEAVALAQAVLCDTALDLPHQRAVARARAGWRGNIRDVA